MEIGVKLKDLRLKCGLTQEELADRCELTKGYISQLENDLTMPTIPTLNDLMVALGSDLKTFFSEDEPEQVVFTDDDFFEKEADGKNRMVGSNVKRTRGTYLDANLANIRLVQRYAARGRGIRYVLDGEIKLLSENNFIMQKTQQLLFCQQ